LGIFAKSADEFVVGGNETAQQHIKLHFDFSAIGCYIKVVKVKGLQRGHAPVVCVPPLPEI
jgi:hypothetical protein